MQLFIRTLNRTVRLVLKRGVAGAVVFFLSLLIIFYFLFFETANDEIKKNDFVALIEVSDKFAPLANKIDEVDIQSFETGFEGDLLFGHLLHGIKRKIEDRNVYPGKILLIAFKPKKDNNKGYIYPYTIDGEIKLKIAVPDSNSSLYCLSHQIFNDDVFIRSNHLLELSNCKNYINLNQFENVLLSLLDKQRRRKNKFKENSAGSHVTSESMYLDFIKNKVYVFKSNKEISSLRNYLLTSSLNKQLTSLNRAITISRINENNVGLRKSHRLEMRINRLLSEEELELLYHFLPEFWYAYNAKISKDYLNLLRDSVNNAVDLVVNAIDNPSIIFQESINRISKLLNDGDNNEKSLLKSKEYQKDEQQKNTNDKEVWERTFFAEKQVEILGDSTSDDAEFSIRKASGYVVNKLNDKKTHLYFAYSYGDIKKDVTKAKDTILKILQTQKHNKLHFIVLKHPNNSKQFSIFYQFISEIDTQRLNIQSTNRKILGFEVMQSNVQNSYLFDKVTNEVFEEVLKYWEENTKDLELILRKVANGKSIKNFLRSYAEKDEKKERTRKLINDLSSNDVFIGMLINDPNKIGHAQSIVSLLSNSKFSQEYSRELNKVLTNIEKKSNSFPKFKKTFLKFIMLLSDEIYLDNVSILRKIIRSKEVIEAVELFRRSPSPSFKAAIDNNEVLNKWVDDPSTFESNLSKIYREMGIENNVSIEELSVFANSLVSPLNPILSTYLVSRISEEYYSELLQNVYKILRPSEIHSIKAFSQIDFVSLLLNKTRFLSPLTKQSFKPLSPEHNVRFYAVSSLTDFRKQLGRASKACPRVLPKEHRNRCISTRFFCGCYSNATNCECPNNDLDKISQSEIDFFINTIKYLSSIVGMSINRGLNIESLQNELISTDKKKGSVVETIVNQIFHRDFLYIPSWFITFLFLVMSAMCVIYVRLSSDLLSGYSRIIWILNIFVFIIPTLLLILMLIGVWEHGQFLLSPSLSGLRGLIYPIVLLFLVMILIVISPIFARYRVNYVIGRGFFYFLKLKLSLSLKLLAASFPFFLTLSVFVIPTTHKGLTVVKFPIYYKISLLVAIAGFYLIMWLINVMQKQDRKRYEMGFNALNKDARRITEYIPDEDKRTIELLFHKIIRPKGFDFKGLEYLDINSGLKDLNLPASINRTAVSNDREIFNRMFTLKALQGGLLKNDFDTEQMGDLALVSFISDETIVSRLSCINRPDLRTKTGAYVAKAWLSLIQDIYQKWTISAYFPRLDKNYDYYIDTDTGDYQDIFNEEFLLSMHRRYKVDYLGRRIKGFFNRLSSNYDILMFSDKYTHTMCLKLMKPRLKNSGIFGVIIKIDEANSPRLLDSYGAYPALVPDKTLTFEGKMRSPNLLEITSNLPSNLEEDFRPKIRSSIKTLIKEVDTNTQL
jgi:hypothetical protein